MSEPSNEQTETAQAQPSHGQKVAEWFASWTASQLATLAITSALGAGAAVQEAIVDELKILVAQGSEAISNAEDNAEAGDIGEKDMKKVEKWIWMANYFIRSLEIPSEPGFFKDTSVVKSDLCKKMEGFDREKDPQTRLHHAKRALVIVEAVRRLAEGGRVP